MPPIKRKTWDHAAMIQAVNAVRKNEMGYLRAAKRFGVPKGTLERYVKKDGHAKDLVEVRMGRQPALPIDLETELESYCKVMDRRFYGLRLQDIKYMAFLLAIKNNLKHPFSVTKASAGKKWLRGFLKRHPTLSIRTPEAVSAARIKGFNPAAVANFFDLYEPELDKIKSAPHRIYNVDETGITVVQHKRSKVVSMKGKKQVGALTSLERGKLMTIVTCMNGQKKRINKKQQTTKKKAFKKKKVEVVSSSSEDDDMPELADSSGDENDAECLYCSGTFSQDTRGEKWAKCQVCFKWAHEDCGDVASNRFLCSLCLDM